MSEINSQLALAPVHAPTAPEGQSLEEKRAAVLALDLDGAVVVATIREHLRRRSGKPWSLSGGRGTAYGWIRIHAPPARRVAPFDYMAEEDRAELGRLLGLTGPVHQQGESIPTGNDYRRVYLARAMFGEDLGFTASPYWD